MRKFKLLLLAVLGVSLMACNDDDEYRGDWARGVSYVGEPRTGAVSFTINNVAYVGLGFGLNNVEFRSFNKYVNGSWMPACDLPEKIDNVDIQGRHGAVAFVIGECAYVGLGFVAPYRNNSTGVDRKEEWLKDFYKYDSSADQWTRVAEFPGKGRRDAVAFSINGYGYVGTGRGLGEGGGSTMSLKDFYRYDPVHNTWTEIPFDGAARYGGVAFVIGGAAHVCLGAEDDGIYARDHYKFVPGADGEGTWRRMQGLWDKPKNHQDAFYGRIPRAHAVSFIASNNEEETDYAYIATGDYNQQYTWWYDHKRDLWHEVEDFPAGSAAVRQAVSFTIEESGIKRGHFTTGGTVYDARPVSQTWYFIPNVREDRGNDF